MGDGDEEEEISSPIKGTSRLLGKDATLEDVVAELEDLAEQGDRKGGVESVDRLRACMQVVVGHTVKAHEHCDRIFREDIIAGVVRGITVIVMIAVCVWMIPEIRRQDDMHATIASQITILKEAQAHRMAQLVEFQKLRGLPPEELQQLREIGVGRIAVGSDPYRTISPRASSSPAPSNLDATTEL